MEIDNLHLVGKRKKIGNFQITMNKHLISIDRQNTVNIITTRKLDLNKITIIKDKLQATDWDELLHDRSTEEFFRLFQDTLLGYLNEVASTKTVQISPYKILKEDWMTPGLEKCTSKQQQLYKTTLRKESITNDHEKYRRYRNNLKQILRRAKEQYYRDKCVEFTSSKHFQTVENDK